MGKISRRGCRRRRGRAVASSPQRLVEEALEVFAVSGPPQRLGQSGELRAIDEPLAVGDFLRAADLQSLPRLDGLDEVGGREERGMCAGIEPGDAAAEQLDL